MKILYGLFGVMLLLAVPQVSAAISIQGFGQGLTGFEGGINAHFTNSNANIRFAQQYDRASLAMSIPQGEFGIRANRPITTQYSFDQNVPSTRSFGDWRINDVDARFSAGDSRLRYQQTAAGPLVRGAINPTGGFQTFPVQHHGLNNDFARNFGANRFTYGSTVQNGFTPQFSYGFGSGWY